MKNLTCAFCSLVATAACLFATQIANAAFTTTTWTFETSIPATAGPFAAEIGTGTATGSHAGAAVYSSPVGNGSAHSFSSNTWASGDYYQFLVDPTGGGSAFTISWDQTGSATGPRDFKLQSSTDGTTFSDVLNYTVLLNGGSPNPTWATSGTGLPSAAYSYSASVTGISATTTLFFRMLDISTTAINGGTVGTAGTDRVDNVTIAATSAATVPEAGTLFTVGGLLGLYGCLAPFRRRKAV